jgi:hypothetical protein
MSKTFQAAMPGTVSRQDVKEFFDFSDLTTTRCVRDGRLPAPDVWIGSRAMWRAQTLPEIAAWRAQQRAHAEREAEQIISQPGVTL